MYCQDILRFSRRKTHEVQVGGVAMGGNQPIRIQSMTTTRTDDVQASVEQCIEIAQAGADYVRLTAQGVKEAEALAQIRTALRRLGYQIPLIADIHFNPAAAETAAVRVEKIRINPGNFAEIKGVDRKQKFSDLVKLCQQHRTAMRIGVNHGSLSDRMLDAYGDTPKGMVESAMEYLRMCKDLGFEAVVVSLKSSNTRVMVQAYRLMAERMLQEGMTYPLHLGVTEAGEGEDGRLKSAVGIGSLLSDGLGDTLRVSLTEERAHEMDVAAKLLDYFENRSSQVPPNYPVDFGLFPAYQYQRFSTTELAPLSELPLRWGGDRPVAAIADLSHLKDIDQEQVQALGFYWQEGRWNALPTAPDGLFVGEANLQIETIGLPVLDIDSWTYLVLDAYGLEDEVLDWLKVNPQVTVMLELNGEHPVAEYRSYFLRAAQKGVSNPVLLRRGYAEEDWETLQIMAACDFGPALLDGYADGVMIQSTGLHPAADLVKLSYGILQAARVRFTSTEYIACPGCGRTLFDLRETLSRVKDATREMKGLKIAVMGCIVNGPGEMADADYGYVGAGPGKVSLYKGKECIQKNIPQEEAVETLVAYIQADRQTQREADLIAEFKTNGHDERS